MPNLAVTLREEISRVSKKTNKAEIQSLRAATATQRRELAKLKKRIAELERGLKRASRSAGALPKAGAQSSSAAESRPIRFSASRLTAQREKLGLSVPQFAKLIGVSYLSVYKWEKGQTRPRQAQLERIASVRGLGKREVAAKLDLLAA